MFLRVELGPGRGHFFSRKRPEGLMDRKIFALRAPKDLGLRPPGSGDPFSNAHPRHSGGASPPRAGNATGEIEGVAVEGMFSLDSLRLV